MIRNAQSHHANHRGADHLELTRRQPTKRIFGATSRDHAVVQMRDARRVGADWGTPVSPTYQPPFAFTGTLNQVTIELT